MLELYNRNEFASPEIKVQIIEYLTSCAEQKADVSIPSQPALKSAQQAAASLERLRWLDPSAFDDP